MERFKARKDVIFLMNKNCFEREISKIGLKSLKCCFGVWSSNRVP